MTWPNLNYHDWKDTYETLHRWLQIVGKLRLCKSPLLNHSWSSTLYVSSRGFTTGPIPLGDRSLTIEFDFLDHLLVFQDSQNRNYAFQLHDEAVSNFYHHFNEALEVMHVKPTFEPVPNELNDCLPFAEDQIHKTYVPEQAYNAWQVFVRVNNVFEEYRSKFLGKSSPVHLFWGAFDLAVTRFSGRRAPEHPGGVPFLSNEVAKEAYSHEVMSCGFWPGNEMYPKAAFYCYAYPEPKQFSKFKISPGEAFYHPDLKEFILPYEAVQGSIDPAGAIMSFMESSYKAAANSGDWDRDILEVSSHLHKLREINQSSFADEAIRQ